MRVDGVRVNPKVTEEAILNAVERGMESLDDPGFCILCGCEACGVEPDGRKIKCESCGANCVYGAEELLLRIAA